MVRTHVAHASLTLLASLGLFVPLSAHAGPLNPPPGAITPTYKTLTQVEPRKDLAEVAGLAGAAKHYISAPGSYYLSANVDATAGLHAIRVAADNVTIDLNGFTIRGMGGTAGDGIYASPGRRNLVVFNGTVAAMPGSGIFAGGSSGCRFENLHLESNGLDGIWPGQRATVTNVRVVNALRTGFQSNTDPDVVYRDCVAEALTTSPSGFSVQSNSQLINCLSRGFLRGIETGSSNLIDGCTVAGAGDTGIFVGNNCRVLRSHSGANNKGMSVGSQSYLEQCVVISNTSTTAPGITAGGRVTIKNCNILNNPGGGILFSGGEGIVTGCNVNSNGTVANAGGGIIAGTNLGGFIIDANTVTSNSGRGISIPLGSQITNNTVRANTHDGIFVTAGCRVASNLVDTNGSAANQQGGIATDGSSNVICDNFLLSNDTGIWCSAQGGNVVIRNTARSSTAGGNYNLFAGTIAGPQVNSTVGVTNPTVNFDY